MPLSLAIVTTQNKNALELSVRSYHMQIRYEPQEKDVLTHINVSVKTTMQMVSQLDPSGNDTMAKDYLFGFKAFGSSTILGSSVSNVQKGGENGYNGASAGSCGAPAQWESAGRFPSNNELSLMFSKNTVQSWAFKSDSDKQALVWTVLSSGLTDQTGKTRVNTVLRCIKINIRRWL